MDVLRGFEVFRKTFLVGMGGGFGKVVLSTRT